MSTWKLTEHLTQCIKNLAVILWQFNDGKNSFIVLVPVLLTLLTVTSIAQLSLPDPYQVLRSDLLSQLAQDECPILAINTERMA